MRRPDTNGLHCLASSKCFTHCRGHCSRGTCKPRASARTRTKADGLGMFWCPEKQRGEAGGLHSNRALGGTEMDLHGNNKAVKEKEKKPYPEIKWVFEIRELTRESLWRKKARAWEGGRGTLGICSPLAGDAQTILP